MADSKNERIRKLKILLMNAPADGFKLEDIIRITGIERKNVQRDLDDIGAASPSYGFYVYSPTQDEIEYAKAVIKASKK